MLKQIVVFFLGFCLVSFTRAGSGIPANSPQPRHSDTADLKNDSDVHKLGEAPASARNTQTTLLNGKNEEIPINPLAMGFIRNFELKYGDDTREIRAWGKNYLDLMDAVLVQQNLPRELKYLAIVESDLKSNAYSAAGAVGPWQLMPETARNMGLKIGRNYDERRDYYKSTQAACKYLKSLYKLYGDWLLVVAAYNSGPGGVNSAIRRSGSRDFWILQRFLPAESQGHVKRFVAIHYVLEGRGSIVTATKAEAAHYMAAKELTPAEIAGTKVDSITGRYNSIVITKYLSMDIALFNRLNPDFDRVIGTDGTYPMRLPEDKWSIFMARKPEILNESMQLLLGGISKARETTLP